MPSYDPKRPRPATGSGDAAPIEAILEPATGEHPAVDPESPADEAASGVGAGEAAATDAGSDVVEPDGAEEQDLGPVEVDLRADADPVLQAGGSEVPVAPAPEGGTANRAVLAAVLGGVMAAVILIVVWRRRRG